MASPLRSLSAPTLLSLAIAIGLGGCAGLPDQRLANEALKRGDTATAEQNYRQLADLGYSDAQVGLADIQVGTRDPELIKQAEATYRAAAETSPRAQSRLGKLLAVKPNSTEAEQREAEGLLKKAFANGEAGTLIPLAMLYLQYPHTFPNVNAQQKINEWRASGYPEAGLAQVLLYRTQGTYDQHLGEVETICKQALRANDVCYMELATVYQKRGEADKQAALLEQMQSGYSMGSVPAMRVDTVARVLADSTIGKPDEKTAQQLLEKVAPSYPASWVSLAQLLYDYPELGDVNKMMEYLDNGRAADQPRAELLLGKLYYEGKLVLPDAKKAEEHLLKAAPTQISAHYYLGQLYRRGYLGHPDAQKAVDELLTSARGGQNSADFALAQLFSQGKGIKPDPVNAWVFGQLAQTQGTPQAADLAQQLNDQLPPEKRAQAQSLLQREQQVRGTTAQNALALQTLQEEKDGEDAPL